MTRDLSPLAERTFDLLVVGGGIYGLTIAYDAAQRGLSVALIDRDDFGSGSTFNHLRTIHGGLRYLQSFDLTRARESLEERRTIARIAPQAVRPLGFVLPVFRSVTSGPVAMRAAFVLDRILGRDRNHGVDRSLWLPPAQLIGRTAALEQFPLLARGADAAAVWHDYVTVEADRLTFAWARAAVDHGAVLANHVEALHLSVVDSKVTGVGAVDRFTGQRLHIRAALTVNATGPSIGRLLSPLQIPGTMPLLKVMNLVTSRPAGGYAVAGRMPGGRHLFMVPWKSRALFGTWESPAAAQPGQTTVSAADVAAFVEEINQAFPSLALESSDVTLVHRGIVPASKQRDGNLTLRGPEFVRDHAVDGIHRLMSVAGTKYTTARVVAHTVVNTVAKILQRRTAPCRTADTPLPGMQLGDAAALAELVDPRGPRVDAESLAHLLAAYGSTARDVLALAHDDPRLQRRISPHSPVLAIQLVWAARREMAQTLTDAVVRRTPLGALGYPGDAASAEAATIVGAALGWSEARRQDELSSLESFYTVRL
jgi:glycerol-3-phosphate dehydrogenase